MPVEQPPVVLAMVVAETVLTDMATGRHTIQGTYHSLAAPAFPLVLPWIVVYVALTDGHGETQMRLQLVDVDETQPPLFELEAQVDLSDPLAVAEVIFTQRNVAFPEPGEYRLQLFGGGQPLLERRLWIVPEEGDEP